MKKLVTIKEASQLTGLSNCEIRRLIKNKTIPYIIVGQGRGKYLLEIDSLNETIKKIMDKSIEVA